MGARRPFRYEWDGTVRRLDLSAVTKLIAAYVSQYADMAGHNARPGVDRLAVETGLNEKTIRRHLKLLRDVGLLVRVRSGSGQGRRGKADEYLLALPEDILERVALVSETRNTGLLESGDNGRVEIENSVETSPEHRTLEVHCSTGTPDSDDRNTGLLESTQVPETTPADNTTPDNHSPLEREVTSREADRPKNDLPQPWLSGHGFCLPCHAAGQVTVAADPINGSVCEHHLRDQAS